MDFGQGLVFQLPDRELSVAVTCAEHSSLTQVFSPFEIATAMRYYKFFCKNKSPLGNIPL